MKRRDFIKTTAAGIGEVCRIVPEEAHRAFKPPAKTLTRVKGTHQADFFRACRGGEPACANLEYSAPLAEIALLGNLAIHAGVGKRIEWDAAACAVPNCRSLTVILKPRAALAGAFDVVAADLSA